MKKSLIAASLLAFASAASAADLTLSVGNDNKYHTNFENVRVGTDMWGLNFAADMSYVRNDYSAYGLSVAKLFSVGNVSVGPRVGLEYFTPLATDNRVVYNAGLEASVPLSKSVAVVVDATKRFDTKDSHEYAGNLVSAGLKVNF